jgi:hypothetical protein
MAKRTFTIEITGYAEIEIDDEVIEVVNNEWREQFYNLRSEAEIVEHVAYNLLVNKWQLSQLDGWADQPDDNATVTIEPELTVSAYPAQ